MTTQVKEKPITAIESFGIQVDHPRNADLLLQSIPNCRLRSAIKATRTVINKKTGEEMVPIDQSRGLATFPSTPGMQLHVNPSKCSYVILDPLRDDDAMCNRIARWQREKGIAGTNTKVNGVKEVKGTLDPHRMKTLCRELRNLLDLGHIEESRGYVPKLKDIDEMPGKYLLNPGSTVLNGQPRFEEDFDKWHARLTMTG